MASQATRNARLRQSLFHAGSEALARTLPNLAGLYGCPFCLKGYPSEAVEARFLTVEHAPLKGLGGANVKLLTCYPCNSKAGHDLDHNMLSRENMLDVLFGTLPKSAQLRLEVGSRSSKVKVLESEIVDDGFELAVEMKAGGGRDTVVQELMRIAESGESATNSLWIGGRFSERKAKIGWIRAGYLVAFALLGYRYILRTDLRAIHNEIFGEALPSTFPLGFCTTADRSERRITIIDKPQWLAGCLAIQLGRHIVILPGDDSQDGFLDRFRVPDSMDPNLHLAGTKEWPWSNRPRFLHD